VLYPPELRGLIEKSTSYPTLRALSRSTVTVFVTIDAIAAAKLAAVQGRA
jgi:hypothetical protein